MTDEEIVYGIHGDAIIPWEDGSFRTYKPEAMENLGERFKGGFFRPEMTRDEEMELLFVCTEALYLVLHTDDDEKPNVINVHRAYKRLYSLYPYFTPEEIGEVTTRMDKIDSEWKSKLGVALEALGWKKGETSTIAGDTE